MRKLLIVLAFAGVSVASMAQDVPTEKYSVATNSFWSNWFIQVGANWNAWYAGDAREHGSNLPSSPFKSFRSNPGAALAIGKWFTPGMGLRLKAQGIWGKDVKATYPGYSKGNKYWILNGHAMFNLSNMLCGYNETRVFNVIPFVGGGIGRSMTHDRYGMGLSAGLQLQFRLAKNFAIHVEGGWNRYENDIASPGAGDIGNRGWDSHTNNVYAELGLTFNLNKATWDKVPNVDALNADWQNRLDALNSQLRDANADNDRLRKMLADRPAAETKTVKEFISTPVSVFFVLDKTEYLQPKDLVDVKAVADYAIQHNRKVRVFGYADSATGSVERNKWLGEHRAEKVANELVKMGVPRENIIEEPQGGVSLLTPTYERSYDRRVLIQVVE